MPDPSPASTDSASRRRFRDYRRRVRERLAKAKAEGAGTEAPAAHGAHGPHGEGKSKRRTRPFFALLRAFLGLLQGHRGTLWLAVGTLTFSTLVGLIPLYGTKLVFRSEERR